MCARTRRLHRQVLLGLASQVKEKPFSSWRKAINCFAHRTGAFILPNQNLFSKSVMYRTRGARGVSELNRTLHESPATASLHSATPKKKCSLRFWFCARPIFSEKGKDIFLFGVLPSKYSGSVAGLQFGLGKTEKLFSGEKDFPFCLD
jgi:hypothetical protein